MHVVHRSTVILPTPPLPRRLSTLLHQHPTDFAKPDKPVTRVHDGIGKLVAEWIWRDARSDLLTIRNRPQSPSSAWLKKSFIPFRDDVKFQDDGGAEYVWKGNKPGLGLQLFGPESKTQPVARFIRTYKDYNANRENPPVVPSALLLDESVEPIRDFIVISFLLLERRRRETETATVSRARSLAIYGVFTS
ncbi:hypothetical protein B0F90DRAFT_1815910 [Multifurca ochricompacta]|uniref:DUF6593 domain-containing protein n=1 Tax=Multifurca ochricompacta TaxID=376703 RepID=A0AAD4QPQ6_9AGAM|nr:hypothetical protein B0F90DRAFT_1815910 [Multifurca ochricompacta]